MYRLPGNSTPLRRQTTDRSPSRAYQTGGVASFCYLGDMLSAASSCELSTTTRVKTAWKKFKELKPVLSSRHLSFKTRGRVYSSCVRSAMLHASETWPVTKPCLQCLQRNDRAMIRQICNVKPQDTATIRSTELLARLGLEDLDLILKERRLRWYGHVERSNGAVKTVFDIQVNGKRGPGGPKMTWKQLTERDRREWKLSAIDPHDRDTWRSGVRSAMPVAWKGVHCCGYGPCTCRLIKNPMMMMMKLAGANVYPWPVSLPSESKLFTPNFNVNAINIQSSRQRVFLRF